MNLNLSQTRILAKATMATKRDTPIALAPDLIVGSTRAILPAPVQVLNALASNPEISTLTL